MSENLPVTPTPKRQDTSRHVQAPTQNASFGPPFCAPFGMSSLHPTTYQIPEPSYPPLCSFPNGVVSGFPSSTTDPYATGNNFFGPYQGHGPSSSQTMFATSSYPALPPTFSNDYGAGNPSFVPNYQSQGTVPPPANVPMSSFNYFSSQESFYPSAGTLPNAATTGFLPSLENGYRAQGLSHFQWPYAMQQPVTQQMQYQVAQEYPTMETPRQYASGQVNEEIYQATVACHTAPSTPQSDQPRSSLPVEDTTPGPRRTARAQTARPTYYVCEDCGKSVPAQQWKKHQKSHEEQYYCKICGRLLSRKDALKRHIDNMHKEYSRRLKDSTLGLLVPQRVVRGSRR